MKAGSKSRAGGTPPFGAVTSNTSTGVIPKASRTIPNRAP
eukprot:CAMPEP_0119540990 /NCGR_PEP_ID=MMETSP1344-20130328/52695_1 /TAXON_ID=236787 /ORGANISM="Florenciella parvula, Strain CCMP2471" /LENGTH=39 /DNA_ID= /DNA_START= /DNA_END= /DNA_ORIENTATION=